MKRTAYFHPALAEELSLLTPDARIHFYSLAARDATSFVNLDCYSLYQIVDKGPLDPILGPNFYEVMRIPKTCIAIDIHMMPKSNVYLHLKIDDCNQEKSDFDEQLVKTSRARRNQLKEKEVEILRFHEFAELYGDPTELKAANNMTIHISQAKYYRRMMIMAYEDTLKDYKSLFNLSDTLMNRVMTRVDGFLKSFNDNLAKRSGGQFNLVVHFRNDALFEAKNFTELARENMDDDIPEDERI